MDEFGNEKAVIFELARPSNDEDGCSNMRGCEPRNVIENAEGQSFGAVIEH